VKLLAAGQPSLGELVSRKVVIVGDRRRRDRRAIGVVAHRLNVAVWVILFRERMNTHWAPQGPAVIAGRWWFAIVLPQTCSWMKYSRATAAGVTVESQRTLAVVAGIVTSALYQPSPASVIPAVTRAATAVSVAV
jgi:hypothetical protein